MGHFRFPFGQPLLRVEQEDRSPKRFFVLGVYASAIHARWLDAHGRELVQALAVASEPRIFWRGDEVADILSSIPVPGDVGTLLPADETFNGPSGRTLDDLYLAPLRASRSDAWLCDLLPESRMNEGQRRAIERHYEPLAVKGMVQPATIPGVPRRFADESRRREILAEILLSQASTLITLGDVPLREFVRPLGSGHARLAHYGQSEEAYGRPHDIVLDGRPLSLIPLAHPRQASRLGLSSPMWSDLHARWVSRMRSESRLE